MSTVQDPSVMAFRIDRARRAPKNWTYWVAGFTAMNGLFLALQHDFMVLAGLVLPFSIPGPSSHIVAGVLLAAIAYFSNRFPRIIWASVVLYLTDTLFAAIAGLWSGLVMHIVVIAFVSLALFGARHLARQNSIPGGADGA